METGRLKTVVVLMNLSGQAQSNDGVSSLEVSPLEWSYDVHGKLYMKQWKKVRKMISAVAPHFPTVMALRRADPGTG